MFSGFYLALLLVLVCLIVRVLSFEWRERSSSPGWRGLWTGANALGSLGASFVWGVGLSALLYGVPLDANGDFTGTFWSLFHPYTVVAGLAVVAIFLCHGATFLTLRLAGPLGERARNAARVLALPATGLGGVFLVWTVVVAVDRNDKSVFPPVLPAALGIAAFALATLLLVRGRNGAAFVATAAGIVLGVATLFTSLYPRVMVSQPSFGNSLTVENAASAHYTLAVMSVVALLVTPLVLLYQGWTYHVFRHRLGGDADRALRAQPEG
jgi:cytochrome d ubiquinol oxidase subunit II